MLPFIVVAAIIRTIDALKTFDTIFVITQGGPGIASETISIHLYLQAFAFHNVGYASALVVVFFVIIVAIGAVPALSAPEGEMVVSLPLDWRRLVDRARPRLRGLHRGLAGNRWCSCGCCRSR